MVQVDVPEGGEESHGGVNGPSLVVVTKGEGKVSWGSDQLDVKRGDVFFVGASVEVSFKAEKGLVMYRALVEESEGAARL